MLTVNAVEVKKHQLRGPVGYTVVGNPTIVDGVVRGFTQATNYLNITTYGGFTLNQAEISFRASCSAGSSTGSQAIPVFYGGGSFFIIVLPASLRVIVNVSANEVATFTLPPSFNTTDYFKYKFVCEDNVLFFYFAEDNGTFNLVGTYTITGTTGYPSYLRIGSNDWYWTQGQNFACSIDLNETYIKVNGKLWFYQPADTKYIVKDGKLVWADPNIYLQSTGTQKIDTGLIRNGTNDNYRFVTSISYQDNQARQLNGSMGFMYFGALYGRYQITNAGSNYENVACPRDKFVNVDVFFDCPNQACSYTVGSASRSFTLPEDALYSSVTAAIYLFNITNNNFPCWCKMKPFKIYKNGILVRDFVPVPTGLVIGNFTVPSNGMFDIVNQQFYVNQGTGEFAIGRDE